VYMVWHGHILSSDIGLVLLAIGLVLSHRPGNPAPVTEKTAFTRGEKLTVEQTLLTAISFCLAVQEITTDRMSDVSQTRVRGGRAPKTSLRD